MLSSLLATGFDPTLDDYFCFLLLALSAQIDLDLWLSTEPKQKKQCTETTAAQERDNVGEISPEKKALLAQHLIKLRYDYLDSIAKRAQANV